MNRLSFTGKKGVSEMVSYVLLIVIAVAVSILVYNYLSVYVPKDKPSCPEDTSLIVDSAACTIDSTTNPDHFVVTLNLKLENRGLHPVDAAFVRLGSSSVRPLIGDNPFFIQSSSLKPLPPQGTVQATITKTLSKGESKLVSMGANTLEIEPAAGKSASSLALCEAALITQPITCTSA